MAFLRFALAAASILSVSQAQSVNTASSVPASSGSSSAATGSPTGSVTATTPVTGTITSGTGVSLTGVSLTGVSLVSEASAIPTDMQEQHAGDDGKTPTAYTLDFNSADHCIGDIVGQANGTAVTETCQTTFTSAKDGTQIKVGDSHSSNVFVYVDRPASGTDNSAIAFYSSPGCTYLVALTNQETCIGTGVWASYKLIHMDKTDDIQWFASQDGAEVVIPVKGVQEHWTVAPGAHLPYIDPNQPNTSKLSAGSAATGTATGSATSGAATGSAMSGTATGPVTTGTAPSEPCGIAMGISDGQVQVPVCSSSSFVPSVIGASIASTTLVSTAIGTTISTGSSSTATAAPLMNREAAPAPVPAPAEIEHMVSGKKMEHGAIRRSFDGEVYKFHQVAKRVWTGVPLAEWDDKLHKRSDIDLELAVSRIRRRSVSNKRHDAGPGYSKRPLSALEARVIPNDKCNLVRTCLVDNGDGDAFSIDSNGEALLSAIASMNNDASKDDFYFLWTQLIVEILDEAGAIQGYIYAHSQYENNHSVSCSSEGTQRDTVASALAQGAAGSNATDMRVDLVTPPNEDTDSLWVSTRAITNADDNIYVLCQAVHIHDAH